MTPASLIPALEERFLEPKDWRWHTFKNRSGGRIRFGSVYPESRIPNAVVVILPGRTEFIEKYFETARDLTARNLAVWILDWHGQGKSPRFPGLPPERGHGHDFSFYVHDLHEFIQGYVKHACVHPDVGRIPMVMMAQSMGGNIGLRYLQEHPGVFECAALCSPMLGITAVKAMPAFVADCLSEVLNLFLGKQYAHGQKEWNSEERKHWGAALTSDEKRAVIHDAWMEIDAGLRLGGVTYGWVYHALRSCRKLADEAALKATQTPCLLTLAGRETLVDNDAIRRAAGLMPHASLLEFPEAGHELLMERDEQRNRFLDAFYGLIKERIIDRPETLKPF